MKIICQYNKKLAHFLEEVVEYTLSKYGQELNLVNLQEIELRDISEFDLKKDGSTHENGTKIMVTSRLYDMLPCLSIKNLENNPNFKKIVNTLYHEMGHITDWTKYPQLYAEAESMNNIKVGLPAYLWLEYLAEKRSCSKDDSKNTELCDQFVKGQWHAHYFSFDDIKEENFFYMNKVISYFMARTENVISREKYMNEISNELLKEYLCELRVEIERLEKLLPFDEPEKLRNLYDIMNKYYKKFCKRYKPIIKWYI